MENSKQHQVKIRKATTDDLESICDIYTSAFKGTTSPSNRQWWNILEDNNNDFILIDGTFFTGDEIPDRNMSEIPHPFITESIELFSNLGRTHRSKVFFTHLNHTNPAIVENSAAYNFILSKGFNLLKEGQIFNL